jgi:hypothetical protein
VPESSPSLLSQLQKLFIRQAAQERPDIRENFLARRRVTLRETVDELAEGELAGAAFEDVGRDCIGLEDPLRRKQDPAALRLVVNEPNPPRQPWPRLGGNDAARIAQALLQSFGTKAPGGRCFGAT